MSGEDPHRRKRREKIRYEEDQRYEARPPSTRPTLASQPNSEQRTSQRLVSRQHSTEAVAGRSSPGRDDPDRQYTAPTLKQITSLKPTRRVKPSRSNEVYDRDDDRGGWERGRHSSEEHTRVQADRVRSRGKEGESSDPVEGRSGYEDDTNRKKGKSRWTRQESGYDDRQEPTSLTNTPRDSRDRHGYREFPLAEGSPGDAYHRERQRSYDDRYVIQSKDVRFATQKQLTLPVRTREQDTSRVEQEPEYRTISLKSSLKRPSQRASASYNDSTGRMTEVERLKKLDAWRKSQLESQYDLSTKLRDDLERAFVCSSDDLGRSADDKGWGDRYRWTKKDAMDRYRKEEHGRRDVCHDFEKEYQYLVDSIYDRYAKSPRKGLPEEGATVVGTVTLDKEQDGLFITSEYTIKVDGEVTRRDDFPMWFRSKTKTDTVKAVMKEVRKLL